MRPSIRSIRLLFDTAIIYGPLSNELLAGEALSPFRGKISVTTKFGHEVINGKGTGRQDSRPETIRRYCDESLRRLKVDAIELFYQHRFDPRVPVEDVAGTISELVKEGKVGSVRVIDTAAIPETPVKPKRLVILLLGSVFVYLLNDDDRGPVSPEMMDEAATGRNKSVYDTLDVLGNYLWRDVMKSAKADSAQRADREREAKERAEREKERKALAPMPATDQDVEAVEEMGSQPSQTVPTPSAPPQPSVAAPKIDKVTAPKVEAIGND